MLYAACCKVEVLNTSLLFLFFSCSWISSISNEFESLLSISFASTSFLISIFLPWYFSKVASKEPNDALIVQYSSGLNASISLSLSTIIFKATLWTRPADLPPVLDCINLDNLKPIILSKILLVSWLWTKSISILRGLLIASLTTSLVISLKTTLSYLSSGIFNSSKRCQLIASPSRSGSVAR